MNELHKSSILAECLYFSDVDLFASRMQSNRLKDFSNVLAGLCFVNILKLDVDTRLGLHIWHGAG